MADSDKVARCRTKPPQADRVVIVYVLSALVCCLLAASMYQFQVLNTLHRDVFETQQGLNLLGADVAARLKRHPVTFHSTRRRRSSPPVENNSTTCFQCRTDVQNHAAKVERRRRQDRKRHQRKLSELRRKVGPLERQFGELSRKVDKINGQFAAWTQNHQVRVSSYDVTEILYVAVIAQVGKEKPHTQTHKKHTTHTLGPYLLTCILHATFCTAKDVIRADEKFRVRLQVGDIDVGTNKI